MNKANPFKIHLSVNVHTISVKLPPGRRGSVEALQLQLESLLLSNKFSGLDLSGAGGEAYQAVGETMQLDFHQFTIARQASNVVSERWEGREGRGRERGGS